MLGHILITLSAHLCAPSLIEGHLMFALLGLSSSADTHTRSLLTHYHVYSLPLIYYSLTVMIYLFFTVMYGCFVCDYQVTLCTKARVDAEFHASSL